MTAMPLWTKNFSATCAAVLPYLAPMAESKGCLLMPWRPSTSGLQASSAMG